MLCNHFIFLYLISTVLNVCDILCILAKPYDSIFFFFLLLWGGGGILLSGLVPSSRHVG